MGAECTKDIYGEDEAEQKKAESAVVREEKKKAMINRILNQETKLKLFNEDRDEKSLDNLSETTSNAVTLSVVPSSRKAAKRCYIEVNLKSFHHNLKQIKTMADATNCGLIAVLKGTTAKIIISRFCIYICIYR